MKPIFRSISLIVAITFIFTVTLYYITHLPVWVLILLCLVLQFLGHWMYEGILVTYYGIQSRKLETEALKELSYQTVDIECPCSIKNQQKILLRLNDTTRYDCDKCQKRLNLRVDISSLLSTDPIKTDIDTFDKLLVDAKNKIKIEN